ncbi:hypothetical protein PGT21_018300 [Puccinia graminis f. sp. tritici]|uniref:Uncharacterized protein n=1 Tax=Puccinia graminis f. sp. tritici TaxID=56615 RepID=A0A5B0QIW9_PUCGR|nr:hypothetical protein PGT21_018300 [Puccinia graminis f. sp. tritici]
MSCAVNFLTIAFLTVLIAFGLALEDRDGKPMELLFRGWADAQSHTRDDIRRPDLIISHVPINHPTPAVPIGNHPDLVHNTRDLPPLPGSIQPQNEGPITDLVEHDQNWNLRSETASWRRGEKSGKTTDYLTGYQVANPGAFNPISFPKIRWPFALDALLPVPTFKRSRLNDPSTVQPDIQNVPNLRQKTTTQMRGMDRKMKSITTIQETQDGGLSRKKQVSSSSTSRKKGNPKKKTDSYPMKDTLTIISEPSPSQVNLKSVEFKRLEFREEVFKDDSLLPDHQFKLARIEELFKTLKVDQLLIPKSDYALWKKTLNGFYFINRHAKSSATERIYVQGKIGFWGRSYQELCEHQHLWFNFWESRSLMNLYKIDLDQYEDEPFKEMKKLFTVYLFYVDMIETIVQGTQPSISETQPNFLQESVKSFKMFRVIQYQEHRNNKNTKATQAKRIPQVLWLYLEYWMKNSSRKDLWEYLMPKQDLINKFKGFFNDIFAYSIKHFNNKLIASSKKRKIHMLE